MFIHDAALIGTFLALVACHTGTDTAGPSDSGETGAADCLCTETDLCCDGCQPRETSLACDDGVVESWGVCSPSTGRCDAGGSLVTLSLGEALWAHAVVWDPAGAWVAVAAEDAIGGTSGAAAIFGVDGSQIAAWSGVYTGVDVSPDGQVVALCGTTLQLVSPVDGAALAGSGGVCEGGAVAFSPDGTRLAVTTATGAEVRTVSDGAVLYTVAHERDDEARLWAIRWSPDGSSFATATGQAGFGSPKGEIKLWSGADGAAQGELDCTAMDVAWSPDGTTLAAACWNSVRLFSRESGALEGEILSSAPVLSVAWSASGELWTGAFQDGVTVYDRAAETTLRALGDESGYGTPKSLAIGPGGALAAATWDAPGGLIWQDLAR